MRYSDLFAKYKQMVGEEVTVRTWDRLIKRLALDDEKLSVPDRSRLVKGAAIIRKVAPGCSVSRELVQSYLALKQIQDSSEMKGAELIGLIQAVKPVKVRAIQKWFERSPNGVRIAATRTYSGEELRFVFEQVLLRLNARPSKVTKLVINSGELNAGAN